MVCRTFSWRILSYTTIRDRDGPTVANCTRPYEDIGDQSDGNLHIFVAVEGCTEVEILQVAGHEAAIGRREDTLLSNSFTVVMSAVLVLTSPRYSIRSPPTFQQTRRGFSFSGAIGGDNVNIRGFSVLGDGGMKSMVSVPWTLPHP